MKLIPYDLEKLPCKMKKTKMLEVLDEFVKSGYPCVKLEGWTHKNVESLRTSLCKAINHFGFNGIKVVIRKKEAFLINENVAPRLNAKV